jgi:hypothetical protein
MSDTKQATASETTAIELGPLRIDNFAELMGDLKSTVSRFQDESTPQNFAAIVTSLQGFGLSGADVWQQAASYAKKNPLRVAAFAGLAFYALKGLLAQAESTRKLIH